MNNWQQGRGIREQIRYSKVLPTNNGLPLRAFSLRRIVIVFVDV